MTRISCTKTLRSLLLSGAAICAPIAAYAQGDSAAPTETVVVTGSLIARPGFETPTPVTAVSAQDLQKSAPTTLADSLNQLPQFGSATSNHAGFQGGGNGGANFINLRQLGGTRTLILLNGERVVSSTLNNGVDFNTLPTTLTQRVDIVTGGASASYGSDAVAGVVNVILNTNFTGFKASAQYGNNRQNAYASYRTDLAGGTSFDGGRGHIVASFSYFDNPQFYLNNQTSWNNGTVLVLNPANPACATNATLTCAAGQPALIHAYHMGLYTEAQGGVITSGPLKNTIFLGANATPSAYNPGQVSGVISVNGDADQSYTNYAPVGLPQHGYNGYTYIKYQITPSILAHLELDYGTDGGQSEVGPYQRPGNITITADNPYIPAQTLALMTAQKIASFSLGTNNMNQSNAKCHCVVYPNHRAQERLTIGFDGSFGDGWTWSAYYGHGETHFIEYWLNDAYIPYYNLAIDAVVAPVGNTAGVAPGSIVCRSTLTNPTNGCKPLNLFGIGNASQAAIDYTNPIPWTQINNKQDTASVSLQGEPFDVWAGPVSIAGGASYRSESAVSYSDPLTYTRQFGYGNALPFTGAVNVYEGFVETVVPLARNEIWGKTVDFNAAGRLTDYSTSGVVETWKLGITDQVTDEWRLRTTWSNDIRAPNLGELFTQAVSGGRSIADPFRGNVANSTLATTKGNPNLNPENAVTVSGGIVYTPDWLAGFQLSADWYSINIKGAIGAVSAENELAYCFQGQTVYCPFLIRNSAGVLTEILSVPSNTAYESTSGLDVEMGYSHDLFGGDLDVHLVANYTDEHTSVNASGTVTDNAGSIGNITGAGGQPKFKSTLTATWTLDPFSLTVQNRFLSSGRLLNSYDFTNFVDNNKVPAVGYLDLRGSYNIAANWQAFFAIDNSLNTPPPAAPGAYNSASAYYAPSSPGTVYDLLGRQYRIGVRVNF